MEDLLFIVRYAGPNKCQHCYRNIRKGEEEWHAYVGIGDRRLCAACYDQVVEERNATMPQAGNLAEAA